MQKYIAMRYEPMPRPRWGVWKKLSDGMRVIALVPERRDAKSIAERIAAALNNER